jgi:hypothetical protein
MNTETSSPPVDVLAELSRLYPEMRFGRLVEMIALLSSEETPMSLNEVDDKRFVEAAFRHMSLRRQHVAIEDGHPQNHHLPGPRAEPLDLILRGCERHPDWCFGLLAGHLAACSGSRLYDAEGEQLIEAA